MKQICILSAIGLDKRAFEKSFIGKSPIELSFNWAKNLDNIEKIAILSDSSESCFDFLLNEEKSLFIFKEQWTKKEFLEAIYNCAEKNNADTIIYAWADCPFLQKDITKELVNLHKQALTEYCFAEAFPYGLAPEIIAKDAIKILLGLEFLANNNENSNKNIVIERDCFFSLIKKDINAFEIETIISDKDMRTWRISFAVDSKRNYFSSLALLKLLADKNGIDENTAIFELGVEKIIKYSNDISVLHSLPAFYALQIASSCAGNCMYCPYPTAHFSRFKKLPQDSFFDNSAKFMNKEDFLNIIKKIEEFSEDAVISLSLWGEAIQHPDILFFIEEVLKKPKFSLLIETTAFEISDDFIEKVKNLLTNAAPSTNNFERLTWIVGLDAKSSQTYAQLHRTNFSLEEAENVFVKLQKAFPDSTYCQFLRIKENENELESFYRYWKEKTNKTIIQKFNRFSNYLEEKSPIDLSPLERNPCWHLRRDFHIFIDGSVPLCHSIVPYENTEYILGNILHEDIEKIWEKKKNAFAKHLAKEYQRICEDCDEYYTFNF